MTELVQTNIILSAASGADPGHDMMVSLLVISVNPYKENQVLVGSEAGGGESGVVGGVAGEWLPVLSV